MWCRAGRGRLTQRAALAVAMVVFLLPATATAADRVEFTIASPEVTASAGLARDTRSDLYWTVNDSGGRGTLYGLAPDGSLRGTLAFRADLVDVQAVAMSGSRLYVADIGDGPRKRDFVTVYEFRFPRAEGQTVSYRAYDFRYPDGAHDAATLLVDAGGRLYVVTKEAKGGIYASREPLSRRLRNTLERVGDAPPYVTDGVFLPKRGLIALRSYVSVEMLDAKTYQPTARAALPTAAQGESLTVSLSGTSLLAGSKGAGSTVYRVKIPTTLEPAPTGGPTPGSATAEPTPEPVPTTEAGSDSNDGAGLDRVGTLRALALAGLLAVVAGLVVALARTPAGPR
jgi:hypothetical protein